jgi:hypothetical protein
MEVQRALCELGTAFLNIIKISFSKGLSSWNIDQQIPKNQNFAPSKNFST